MAVHWHIHSFEILPSTQDVAKQYLNEGRHLPLAVQADVQTAGRGRSGNTWVSRKGNLFSSLVIPLKNVNAQDAGQYSFLAAVALMNVLTDLGITDIQNKWPNDVLVGGKKIAGILLESDIAPDGSLKSIIIGVGVNLVAAPEGAVYVQQFTNIVMQPLEFLDKFTVQIQTQLDQMAVSGFAPIRKTWLSHAYGLGTDIRVRLSKETFFGEFLGLDESGALLVKVAGEATHRTIHSGEVFFRDIKGF